jgi:hypothetical protein
MRIRNFHRLLLQPFSRPVEEVPAAQRVNNYTQMLMGGGQFSDIQSFILSLLKEISDNILFIISASFSRKKVCALRNPVLRDCAGRFCVSCPERLEIRVNMRYKVSLYY